MKTLLALPILMGFSSCCLINMVNESSYAIERNREAVDMSTEAIYRNIDAIERANEAIDENKRKLEEINKSLSDAQAA